jgi:hypothetical protein
LFIWMFRCWWFMWKLTGQLFFNSFQTECLGYFAEPNMEWNFCSIRLQ